MPKGKFGLPRPFSEYRIIINPHEKRVEVFKVGPLGGPRPFAKDNPPVSDERVAECILSDAGQSFGAGVVSGGNTTDIEELDFKSRQQALRLAEEWCRGSLEAQAIEDMEEEEAIPRLSRIRRTLENQTNEDDEVSIEIVGDEQDVQSAIRRIEE